jgi:hypothetical protein
MEEIKSRRDWMGSNWIEDDSDDESSPTTSEASAKSVRLLDYACGTGMVSRVSPHSPLQSQNQY